MAAQVSAQERNRSLLEAVKTLSKTSKYHDRWMADTDVCAAVRHEYELWDPKFSKIVTFTNINKAVDSDEGLSASITGPDDANSHGIFRKEYKPKTIVVTSVSEDGTEYNMTTKNNSRTMKWYFFRGARKKPRMPKALSA